MAFGCQVLLWGGVWMVSERLLLLDLTEQQIQRLHAPVGIDIGSKTPAEIAVAILADIIKLYRAAT